MAYEGNVGVKCGQLCSTPSHNKEKPSQLKQTDRQIDRQTDKTY